MMPATPQFFHKHREGKHGLNPACRVCRKLQKQKWYGANADRVRAQMRRYGKRYYEENVQELTRYQQKYRERNRERERVRHQKYHAENLERERLRIRTKSSLRRAKLRQSEGQHDSTVIWQLYEDQGAMCAYCEITLDGEFHVDHMIPLMRGGHNGWQNLAIACVTCNLSKGAKTPEEFMVVLME